MHIDITYARTLTDMSTFLQYLVSIYGAELYKDKQRLYNLIADLYTGEERQKKLFRRAIIEDSMAQRVYELEKKKIEERKALADAIAYRFAENNFFSKEIGQEVTLALVRGMNLSLESAFKQSCNESREGVLEGSYSINKQVYEKNVQQASEIILQQRQDGKWEDEQGNIYSKDKLTFEEAKQGVLKVFIREGTKRIGLWAFQNCTSLVSVTIPKGVMEIGWYAFQNCTSLVSVMIPDSVTEIGWYAFYGCTSLTSITIPDHVSKIGLSAFYNCTSLSTITLSDSVTEIGDLAFSGCTSLKKILATRDTFERWKEYFPTSAQLEEISSVANIEVTNTNSNKIWSDEFGGVYSADRKILIKAPNVERYSIMEGTLIIADDAFTQKYYQQISIPDSLIEIREEAIKSEVSEICIGDNKNFRLRSGILYTEDFKRLIKYTRYIWGGTKLRINDVVESIDKYAFIGNSFSAIECYSKNFVLHDGVLYTADFSRLIKCTTKTTLLAIPDNIKIIDDSAFDYCYFETIELSLGNEYYKIQDGALYSSDFKRFIKCKTTVTNLTVPNSVAIIDDFAFYECKSLQTISIPNKVTHIGKEAFRGCVSLENITIPEGIKIIESCTFNKCESLTSVVVPEGVTAIGDAAFLFCNSLKNISLPNSVTHIGRDAFHGCTSLKEIIIPEHVQDIKSSTFSSCNSLTKIVIPRDIINIEDSAFEYCHIEQIELSPENRNFVLQNGVLYSSDFKRLVKCTANNKVFAIPNGVTVIGNSAFYKCDFLNIIIPNSVTAIGDYAFSRCKMLNTITIPNSVTRIGNGALGECDSLSNITIPNKVKNMGSWIFHKCSSLRSITLPNNITRIERCAFIFCIYNHRTTKTNQKYPSVNL